MQTLDNKVAPGAFMCGEICDLFVRIGLQFLLGMGEWPPARHERCSTIPGEVVGMAVYAMRALG
jgi:hypothetical protein